MTSPPTQPPRVSAAWFLARLRTEFLLFATAGACYLLGLGWGLPEAVSPTYVHLWAYDDISPLPALVEVYHTFVRPEADPWLTYPPFHHYLLGAAYAPYLGWLALTGRFAHPSPVFPFGLADPVAAFRALTLIARVISVLMAAGIIVAVYRIGATAWDRATGIWASLAAAATYPMFYYSKTACLEVPYLFWGSLAWLAYARILSEGPETRLMAALGVLAALAAATKDQAAGLFLLLPLPLALAYRRNARPGQVSWKPAAALLGAGSATYAVAGGLVFDFRRFLDHIRWILQPDGMLAEEFVSWYPESIWFADSLPGKLGQTGAVLGAQVRFLGPVLLMLACIGFLVTARRCPTKIWLAFPALSYCATFLLVIGHFQLRYAMPVMLAFALFAGPGLEWLRQRLRGGTVFALLVAIAFAWPVRSSARLVYQMLNDTRLEAERWLRAAMAQGDRLAAAHEINALPRPPRDVEIIKLPTGQAALARLKEDPPEFVSVIPDWSSEPGTHWSRAYPRELFDKLADGSLGYALAAAFDSGFWPAKPLLDYPAVSPPVRIYRRVAPVPR